MKGILKGIQFIKASKQLVEKKNDSDKKSPNSIKKKLGKSLL